MGQAIAELFTDMTIIAYAFIIAGILLCIIEILQKTRFIAGGIGALLIAAGSLSVILVRPSPVRVFLIMFIVVGILTLVMLYRIYFYNQIWLKRKPVLSGDSANPENKDYYFLLNLEGVAVTDIIENGKITINSIEFDVFNADKTVIPQSSRVRVVAVAGRKITVRETDKKI